MHPAAKSVAVLLGAFAILCVGFYLGKGAAPAPESALVPRNGATVAVHAANAPHEVAEPSKHAPPDPGHADHDHRHPPPEIPRNEAPSGVDPEHVADPRDVRDFPGLLAGLRAAVAEGDPNQITAYQNAILAFTRGDEGRALEVIEAFRKEEHASVLDVLASAIASDPSFAANPRIAEAFLGIAEKSDENAARRQSAFYFLAQTRHMPPALEDRVASFARSESDPALKSGAIQAMSQFARTDEARTPVVNGQLLDVARGAEDPLIRSGALGAVQSRASDEATIAAVAGFLHSDRDGEVRRAAAESLGGVPAPIRVAALTELEKSYRVESAVDVKRTILMSIVRAGRMDAGATLERLIAIDPQLTRDVQDYLDILKSGETDVARIMDEKAKREAGR